jgi:hypothetical protein
MMFTVSVDPLNASYPPGYSTLGDAGLTVTAISDQGLVVGGFWNNALLTQTQFLYKSGGYTFLNIPFYTSTTQNLGSSFTSAINMNGEVVGSYLTSPNGFASFNGFFYSDGEYTSFTHPLADPKASKIIPGTNSPANGTQIADINNLGEIVGTYIDAMGNLKSYKYSDYKFTVVSPSFGETETGVGGINDRGHIVGHYVGSDGFFRGFIFSDGQYQQLDYPGGVKGTSLWDINNFGSVIGGFLDANGKTTPFHYKNGKFENIPIPEASIYNMEINNKGQIAGSYTTGDYSKGTAKVTNFFTQAYDLSTQSKTAVSDNVYLLYQAAFDRLPDEGGFKYWSEQVTKSGLSNTQLANFFMASSEFKTLFGETPSNADYVTKLYSNVLGRQPDILGAAYWTQQLDSGVAKDVVLIGFALGTENVTNAASYMSNGYWVYG